MTKHAEGSVMVVGAGISGIQASLDLADSGYLVYLVDKKSAIGGVMAKLDKTFPTNDCSMCIISPKLVEAGRHLNIELLTLSSVEEISGEPGNFTVTISEQPRYVDMERCTACGECIKVCPVDTPNIFDENLRLKKAAFKLYPQAMPGAYAIEKKGVAPCKSACPAHPGIQGFIALSQQGKFQAALDLFRRDHPFPGVCGRVCHHPCEGICTRDQVDAPVAIRSLHRYLFDKEYKTSHRFVPEKKQIREEKIAIIGAGPAGLTCAYFLGIEGYRVSVFEKLPLLGGMLSVGIPSYRLPRDVIGYEVEVIKELGVEFVTGVEIGKDITIGRLREQGFAAFFIGIGAHECKRLGIEGEGLDGVYSGIEFLREFNLGHPIALKNRVAVIGGGNVAIDAVRTALRTGSAKPMVIYRRSEAEMPADPQEIRECREEGIEILTLTNPVRILGENGKVTGLECIKMELGDPDDTGRRRPVPITGTEFVIDVDNVITAIGQESDWACLTEECACSLNEWRTLSVDPVTFQTDDPDIFSGGDAVTGPATVVDAIAAGKEAAISIDRFVQGRDLHKGRSRSSDIAANVNTEAAKPIQRQAMPLLSEKKRIINFDEVQLGFDDAKARLELDRCLSCGVCSECYECVTACLPQAIDHDMTGRKHTVNVGAVILAPGFKPFDPSVCEPYGYGTHPNIVTSLEFERMLSASGPYEGHLIRPSDRKPPSKIAWLQCVGSRDINQADHSYCSSVCCMYATKEAVIAKEHSQIPLNTTIFFMDMRTFGKEFEKYYMRAEEESGVRYIRSRVHSVFPYDENQLRIVYTTESGTSVEDVFDMVVLSIGMSPADDAVDLANKMGIDLNRHGYVRTESMKPVSTSRDGIYVCGTFQEPKDIPQSVTEASAAAAAAAEPLSDARWSLTREKQVPPEIDVSGQEPRIGVFVCNCGINIGGIADVPAVSDYAQTLPSVVHVEQNLFTCSQDTQDHMKQVIRENGINRVVVASCSPRTHESLFQDTIQDAGLNRYLFEMANIRDQNTWVHMNEPKKATQKAKDLVRMAVAKAAYVEPLYQEKLDICQSALVVGGGVAGMESALSIADQGFDVHLVEKTKELGGIANVLRTAWQGEPVGPYLADLKNRTISHPRISVHLNSQITSTGGSVGRFATTIRSEEGSPNTMELLHGITVLATGGREYQPKEYLYGQHLDILTHLDLDAAFSRNDNRLCRAKSAVFLQCVGSRILERPYCSKVCCTHSLKAALALKQLNPRIKIFILYRDIRSFGFREDIYKEARENGILFIRYDLENPPQLENEEDGSLLLKITDHVLGMPIHLHPDLVILASAVLPAENKHLFERFKVPVNSEGFLVEAHAKLRPVDFASDGIFLAGLAHYPKPLEESIAQAKAAAARAMTILSRESILVGGIVSTVDHDRCAACLTCVRTCPFGVPYIGDQGYAVINASECHGCGICAAECPGKAITLKHFTDFQIMAKESALFQEETPVT
ncbi:MAG: FAD-dependent oxidoreductase [Desulfobacterales bacterium]